MIIPWHLCWGVYNFLLSVPLLVGEFSYLRPKKNVLFPISRPTVKTICRLFFFFLFFFFVFVFVCFLGIFFRTRRKKIRDRSRTIPVFIYVCYIRYIIVYYRIFFRTDFRIFSVFIVGLFISNIAAPLQAKLSTLVQFISKRAATSRSKIK